LNSKDTSFTPDANFEKSQAKPGLPDRLWKWIDQRTGADRILRSSLDEPVPGGARFAYVFGSALLFIVVSQIVTGLCLALYYVPSPFAAHASVSYIVKEVAAGSFLRSLHSYGSTAMLVVLLLHFLQTFLYGSYKGKRELLWIAGCILALLVLGMTFTGYLLTWDQSGYSAGAVGTDIVGEVPFIGNRLAMLLRGGAMMGALTLSRFYLLHVLIIPGLIFSFIAIHIFLFRKAGAAGPANEDPVKPKLPTETFYPKQVLIDMTFVLVVMGVLGMLAHFVPVMLGPEANPANTNFIPRPEFYFLPMFQWLKYWHGRSTVIGAFIIPVILIGLFFLLPFMDRGLERRPWRRPIPIGGVLIVLVGLVWLGMTSRLQDSRDPIVAAQLAEQNQEEHAYFYSAFKPYSAPSPSGVVVSTSLDSTATGGKAIFDSHGCSGCHGQSGGGGVGPALTHIASQYPPAQLTALLKAPRANMKAAGMVALTLNAADMKALVSYLASLGGTSAESAATPAASGAASPAPAKAEPDATAGASKAAPAVAPTASGSSSAASAKAVPDATAGASKTPAGSSTDDPTVAEGKAIFDSHGCSGCHGQSGGGGTGPALTNITTQYPPVQLTALLKAPRANMKAAGMVPLTLNAPDMKALVSYLTSLEGTPAVSAAQPDASDSPSPVSAKLAPAATAAPTELTGEAIFKARCASCHGANGVGDKAPRIGGQNSTYLVNQLLRFSTTDDAHAPEMTSVAKQLDREQIRAVAAFLASR
jgi:ubiquinol-cytochrome c reductase cytochrome b subunit